MSKQESWLHYLKRGLSRQGSTDNLANSEPPQDLKTQTPSSAVNDLLWPLLRKYWPKALFGVVLIIFAVGFTYFIPLVNRFLIDDVILKKKIALLPLAVLGLAALAFLGKLSSSIQNYYFSRFGQRVTLDIQHDLFGRVLHFPKSFFDDKQTGYLMSRISSDVGGLQWFFSGTLVYVVDNTIRFIAGIIFMFYLNWQLAIGILLLLPPFIGLVFLFSGKMKNISHKNMEQQANVAMRMQESLSSIILLKTFNSEKRETAKIKGELDSIYHVSSEQSAVSVFANFVVSSFSELAKLIVLLAGIPMIINNHWTPGSLFAFFSYQSYVYGPAQFMAQMNFQMQTALAALERVAAFYKILPEEHNLTGKKVKQLRGKVEFINVSFSYDKGKAILDRISFTLNPGEHIALVGPSGVGKSTLVNLILGLYQPLEGEICFDDLPLKEYNLGFLRRRLGYVAQNTKLLSGTILENLRYGDEEASESAVVQAANIAGIDGFIESLPAGYKSLVGENGVNFSEGQKQRLALARALIKNPDILILDEPSSALDALTEESIFRSLPRLVSKKSIVLITHRVSTVVNSDKIFVFNHGKIVAVGTHAELLKSCQYYCQQIKA